MSASKSQNADEAVYWCLVRSEGARRYRARGLFSPHEGVGPTLDHALRKLQESLEDRNRWGHDVERLSGKHPAASRMWGLFLPKVEVSVVKLDEAAVRGVAVPRQVLVVEFEVGGVRYRLTPTWNDRMWIAGDDAASEVMDWFRRDGPMTSEDGELNFDGVAYRGGDTLAGIHFQMPAPAKAPSSDDIFARMFGRQEFDGAQELTKVGDNLVQKADADLLRAVERDDEVALLELLLSPETTGAVAIVGEQGAGKTSVIHEFVRREQEAALRESQFSGRHRAPIPFFHVEPQRVIAGMSRVGDWERRFTAILEYAKRRHRSNRALRVSGPVAHGLYFSNPVALLTVGYSAQTRLSLADVLGRFIDSGNMRVVLECTPDEWSAIEARARAFSDRFRVIRLRPYPEAAAWRVVGAHRAWLEAETNVNVATEALVRVWEYARFRPRFGTYVATAVRFLEELVAYGEWIDASDVDEEAPEFLGLNARLARLDARFGPQECREHVERLLVGQKDAVDALVDVTMLVKTELADRRRPIASLLFVGPTGVGKTEAAKVLSQTLLGGADAMVRFDMNEYVDSMAAQRLMGDGQNPGALTAALRARPFTVVLLDEIEKAHSSVHDLLLQILGDARLTDQAGRTADFSRTVIILTSNLGAEDVGRRIGLVDSEEERAATYRRAVESFFRPELVNRFSRIVGFTRLNRSEVEEIVRILLPSVLHREGLRRRRVFVSAPDSVVSAIAERGFDPEMGARAVKRELEDSISRQVARVLVARTPDEPVLVRLTSAVNRGIALEAVELEYMSVDYQPGPFPEMAELNELILRCDELLRRAHGMLPDDTDEERVVVWPPPEGHGLEQVVREVCERLGVIGRQLRLIDREPTAPTRVLQLAESRGRRVRRNLKHEVEWFRHNMRNYWATARGEQLADLEVKEGVRDVRARSASLEESVARGLLALLDSEMSWLELVLDGDGEEQHEFLIDALTPVSSRLSSFGSPLRALLDRWSTDYEEEQVAGTLVIRAKGSWLRAAVASELGLHELRNDVGGTVERSEALFRFVSADKPEAREVVGVHRHIGERDGAPPAAVIHPGAIAWYRELLASFGRDQPTKADTPFTSPRWDERALYERVIVVRTLGGAR